MHTHTHIHTFSDLRITAAVDCHPDVQLCISKAGTCAVCRGPFVNSWLECAQFTPARKVKGKAEPYG